MITKVQTIAKWTPKGFSQVLFCSAAAQNSKMGGFPYVYDSHPRDKKREFLNKVVI